jgi:hypothetical protein
MVIDPAEAQCLSGVLLMDQGDRLAVDSPVVALDDQVLAAAIADEFRTTQGMPRCEARALLTDSRAAGVLHWLRRSSSHQTQITLVRRSR